MYSGKPKAAIRRVILFFRRHGRIFVGSAMICVAMIVAILVIHMSTPQTTTPIAQADQNTTIAQTGSTSGSQSGQTKTPISPSDSPTKSTAPQKSTTSTISNQPAQQTITPVPPTTAQTPPPTGNKPSAANTGYPSSTPMTMFNGFYTVTTDGAVIDGLTIRNSLTIRANNVTVKNSWIQCYDVNDKCIEVATGTHGTVIEDTEVGGGSDHLTYTGSPIGIAVVFTSGVNSATNTRILRTNIHHTLDGVHPDGNTTIEDSYIHHLDRTDPTGHGDGIQVTGGRYLVFRHNTIIGGLNACIYFNWDNKSDDSIANATVDNNWLEGSMGDISFNLYINSGITPGTVTVTNNQFDRTGNPYAPVYDTANAIGMWFNNKYEDGAIISGPARP